MYFNVYYLDGVHAVTQKPVAPKTPDWLQSRKSHCTAVPQPIIAYRPPTNIMFLQLS